MQKEPFKGLKVVELASVLAGPAVGMFFAELGAEVLKIENARTNGDVTRRWKGAMEDPDSPYSAYYHSINWGKKSVLLDLRKSEDRAMTLKYIREADVLITNFRKGSAAKLGMDYQNLKSSNPRLIQVNLTGFGEEDPTPAFDIVLQAETGYLFMTGHVGGPVARMPVALIDLLSGHQMKEAVLIALLQRERTGRGCYTSVSLAESAIASLANQASNWLNVGFVPQQMGTTHPNIAPYGDLFTTSDDCRFVLAIGTEKHFRRLCQAIELNHLPEDERFCSNRVRVRNRPTLVQLIQERVGQLSKDEIMKRFKARQVPVGIVRNMREVFELPIAQSLILEREVPNQGIVKAVKTAVFRIGDES